MDDIEEPDYWEEGHSAYYDGLRLNQCPYPENAPGLARVEWEGGWMAAEEEEEGL